MFASRLPTLLRRARTAGPALGSACAPSRSVYLKKHENSQDVKNFSLVRANCTRRRGLLEAGGGRGSQRCWEAREAARRSGGGGGCRGGTEQPPEGRRRALGLPRLALGRPQPAALLRSPPPSLLSPLYFPLPSPSLLTPFFRPH